MLEGITSGFILSLVLFPGNVWLVKVGVAGNSRQVFVVALGFALSQIFWLMVSVPGLLMMMKHLTALRSVMHLFATFVLLYMAFKTICGRQVDVLNDAGELPPLKILFRNAFNRALAMPMRLPTAMAILLSTGTYTNNLPDWESFPSVALGALVGVIWWWGQLFLVTVFFVNRVPENITLKSLNKIRPFCTILLVLLSIVSLLLLPQ